MKKRVVVVMAIVLALAVVVSGIGVAFAGSGHPSAKSTAQIKDISIIDRNVDMGWTTLLTQTIKTPNQKDLFIDVSLQSGLYTLTKVKGKQGDSDSQTANAMVKVRVLVDGTPAYPGLDGVVFNAREQTLTAVLGGVLEECVLDPDTGIITCTFTDEEIELILKTMSANSFNFIVADLTSGVHTIEVQAMIDVSDAVLEGDVKLSEAKATIGMGSVTIEQVRMIQGEDWCVGSDDLPCPE